MPDLEYIPVEDLRLSDVSLVTSIMRIDKDSLKAMREKYGDKLLKKANELVFKNGQLARDMARRKAPKKTGALRASIYVTRPGAGNQQISSQSYSGYYRAISSAMKKNKKLELSEDATHLQTQRGTEKYSMQQVTLSSGKVIKALVTNEAIGSFASFPTELYKQTYFYVLLGASVYYAPYIEYGTSRQKAQPFIGPAAEWALKKNIEDIKLLFMKGA